MNASALKTNDSRNKISMIRRRRLRGCEAEPSRLASTSWVANRSLDIDETSASTQPRVGLRPFGWRVLGETLNNRVRDQSIATGVVMCVSESEKALVPAVGLAPWALVLHGKERRERRD